MPPRLSLKGLRLQHVLSALADLDRGVAHPFGPSTRYELIHDGRRYPPKAAVGLAAKYLLGRTLTPKDFSAGERAGQANNVLRRLGFTILPKANHQTNVLENSDVALPLTLHHRYKRKEVFASRGMKFSQQNRNQIQGLSPQCPDDGYFIFVTIDKEGFDPAHNYEDEIFRDTCSWVTKRGVRETDVDYVRLRRNKTRVSLFVRNNSSEDFAYLGEVKYQYHKPFIDMSTNRPQLLYDWALQHSVPDELLESLTLGKTPKRENRSRNKRSNNTRRPSNFDEYKRAFHYVLDSAHRTIVPAHHNYQVHLSKTMTERGLDCEFESGFVDVRFTLEGVQYIGEIKVTTTLQLSHAFRFALGQLLEYAHLKYNSHPHMIMFLDQILDAKRLALATKLQISVVVKDHNTYRLMNPSVAPALTSIFKT